MRYSDLDHPDRAHARHRRVAGNYVLVFSDGSTYAGRQSAGVDRLGKHIRGAPRRVAAVAFMRDGTNSECERVARERATVRGLIEGGHKVRKKIAPSVPRFCR